MNDPTNTFAFCDTRSRSPSLALLALFAAGALIGGVAHAEKAAAAAGKASPSENRLPAPTLSRTVDDREPLSALANPPASRQGGKKPDKVSSAGAAPNSGERFPDTPVGRALHEHLLILVDISAGADDRKESSLEALRKNAKEATAALVSAYHRANPTDYFGRWLLSLTLAELKSNEAYSALSELAKSEIPAGLKDNDLEGSALANESAIRQNAADGLAQLARAGNAAAEKDLLSIAMKPPSGDDAVRTVAIKGYLAAGRDFDVRVRAVKAQLPARYHDVATLSVERPEPVVMPGLSAAANSKKGGQ